jgi:hypothetical protein
VFFNLSHYCFSRQLAILERRKGNINNALAAERACDMEYRKLAAHYKW